MGGTERDTQAPPPPQQKVLVCLCGECAHWEIIASGSGLTDGDGTFDTDVPVALRCMTCNETFPIKINVPAHDKLAWATPKEVKVT